MPEMIGPELASRLVGRNPELRVLLASGYALDAIPTDVELPVDVAFIEKPFYPDTLIRRVREVMED